MKIVGYQIFLRITRFVTLVIRPDYQKLCLRSTPVGVGCYTDTRPATSLARLYYLNVEIFE